MGRKCCVLNCKGNYDKENKAKTFRLPSADNDLAERNRWISNIPNKIVESKNTVVCEAHWPVGYETVKLRGKERPKDAPTIFTSIPKSMVPTPQPKQRPTKTCFFDIRTRQECEYNDFLAKDALHFDTLEKNIEKRDFSSSLFTYNINGEIHIQSLNMFTEAVPAFLLKMNKDLRFTAYHGGVRCFIPTLAKNRICLLDSWSKLEEAIRFLRNKPWTQKMLVLKEQIESIGDKKIGEKKWSNDGIIRAFKYYATSRVCYEKLRSDFEFPNASTMRQITSKFDKISDEKFVSEIFANVDERQKKCVILVDEVYVKPSLRYQGGEVFGRAENNPDQLANTILAVMVKCLFGGPKVILKMIPISKLSSDFLYQTVSGVIDSIKSSHGEVVAVITDNNRTNQAFFKRFETEDSKPWKSVDGIYLLFDYVHLIKSLRNNWITEKCQELRFTQDNEEHVAQWNNIRELFRLEKDHLVKLSNLTETSVAPKPIERQRVSTVLQVFCDKTLAALKTHPNIDRHKVEGTILFLERIVDYWKVVSNKNLFLTKFGDPLNKAITIADENNLDILRKFSCLAKEMKGPQGKRVKSLTRDTSLAIQQTCNGIIELTQELLRTSHDYVLLGEFSTDDLEEKFGEFRQGSGGSYFITVQNVLQKLRIQKVRFRLHLKLDTLENEQTVGHLCKKCEFMPDDASISVLDNLEFLEKSLSEDVLMAMVYIAGYLSTKVDDEDDDECLDTTLYYEKYGEYFKTLNRGGLCIPKDKCCQFTIFSYVAFHSFEKDACRTSMKKIFAEISRDHDFMMKEAQMHTLANIFFKNFVILSSPQTSQERALKVLKLAV